MRDLESSNPQRETVGRRVRGRREGEWGASVEWDRVAVFQDEKFWGWTMLMVAEKEKFYCDICKNGREDFAWVYCDSRQDHCVWGGRPG